MVLKRLFEFINDNILHRGGDARINDGSRKTSGKKVKHIKDNKPKKNYIVSVYDSLSTRLKNLWAKDLARFVIIVVALMVFTSFLMMIVEKDSGMYTGDIDKSLIGRFVSSMYFGIVSLSTSGYGDYTPRTIFGRVYTIFFLSTGVMLFSMLTATIASILVEQKLKEGRGLGDLSHIKNHFIICGWKNEMETVLCDIVNRSHEFESKDLVVIANVDPEKAILLRQQNPCLKDFNFLRGDYFNEAMLNKANVANAKQVFILADESQMGTVSEVDSRTVMAAMTITQLSKHIRICAELLDSKYERYLQNAHVDEIIYTNDYARLIMANASGSDGLPQIVNKLLDIKSDVNIRTKPFPSEFIGRPFSEINKYFKEKTGGNVIGLLENVGNHYMHKQEAIKEAQKTPDISKLVENLQKVKEMSSNAPNLHPDDDYVVPKNTLAIVIEKIK